MTSKGGLIACRFLLGLFESGFFPGCTYLISMYYRRYELQWRYNISIPGRYWRGVLVGCWLMGLRIWVSVTFWRLLASFGQILRSGTDFGSDGVAGYEGWRWIFILEGLLTAVFAVLGKFFIVDWPETAKFLTEEEKRLLIARLAVDVADSKMYTLDSRARKRIFGDWKMYLGVVMYFGIVNTGYATSVSVASAMSQYWILLLMVLCSSSRRLSLLGWDIVPFKRRSTPYRFLSWPP